MLGRVLIIIVLAQRLPYLVVGRELAMNLKFEVPFMPLLLLLSTDMAARVAVQGFEQGLLSAVIDWLIKRGSGLKFFSRLARF